MPLPAMISLFVSLVIPYRAIATVCTVTTKLFCTLTNKYDDNGDDDDCYLFLPSYVNGI